MHIDSYEFGTIVIDGRTFHNDLLIWPGQLKTDWWRLEGHLLQVPDVAEALAADPRVLVVGTGAYGNMLIDRELEALLQKNGIELVARKTREACQYINVQIDQSRLAVALHLTC